MCTTIFIGQLIANKLHFCLLKESQSISKLTVIMKVSIDFCCVFSTRNCFIRIQQSMKSCGDTNLLLCEYYIQQLISVLSKLIVIKSCTRC